jgi:CRP-like cAMP-binding protein
MIDTLFEELPTAVRERARARFRAISAAPGEVLIEPTSPTPGALYITSGQVEVVRDGIVIDHSWPGELVGEMSLFTGRPPVATVRASEPTEALALDAEGFTGLHADRNEVAYRFERVALMGLARRLRRLDKLIVEHGKGERSPYARPPTSALERIKSLLFGAPEPEVVRPRPRHPVEILYDSKSFRHLDPNVRTAIAAEMKLQAVPAGTFLCTQGEAGDAMFLLAFGHVDVFVVLNDGKIHRLGEIGDGMLFGLTALMDDRPRVASCVTRDKVDVLALPRDRWKRMYGESTIASSALRVAVITAFADQLDEAGKSLVSVAIDDPIALASAARLDHVGLMRS